METIDRRSFIGRAAAAVAGVMVPPTALGATESFREVRLPDFGTEIHLPGPVYTFNNRLGLLKAESAWLCCTQQVYRRVYEREHLPLEYRAEQPRCRITLWNIDTVKLDRIVGRLLAFVHHSDSAEGGTPADWTEPLYIYHDQPDRDRQWRGELHGYYATAHSQLKTSVDDTHESNAFARAFGEKWLRVEMPKLTLGCAKLHLQYGDLVFDYDSMRKDACLKTMRKQDEQVELQYPKVRSVCCPMISYAMEPIEKLMA